MTETALSETKILAMIAMRDEESEGQTRVELALEVAKDVQKEILRHISGQQPTANPAGSVPLPEGWEFTNGGGVTEVFDIAQWNDVGGIWRDDETGLPVLHAEGDLKDWPSGKINAVLVQVNRSQHSGQIIAAREAAASELLFEANQRAASYSDKYAAAAKLLADCRPYLKDDETPGQRLAQNHAESLGLMELLTKAREVAARADAVDANEQEILKVIDERDHREGIIDMILDVVLGSDRPEWSSAYGYEDAVIDVIDKVPPVQAIQPAADGDLVLIERGLIGAACHAIEKKRDAPNLLAKLRAVTMAAGRADAVLAAELSRLAAILDHDGDEHGVGVKLRQIAQQSAHTQQMRTHGDDEILKIAGCVGVYYYNGKVNLGSPLYAFTRDEMIAFARRLTGSQS